jgi:hypothetical protein
MCPEECAGSDNQTTLQYLFLMSDLHAETIVRVNIKARTAAADIILHTVVYAMERETVKANMEQPARIEPAGMEARLFSIVAVYD